MTDSSHINGPAHERRHADPRAGGAPRISAVCDSTPGVANRLDRAPTASANEPRGAVSCSRMLYGPARAPRQYVPHQRSQQPHDTPLGEQPGRVGQTAMSARRHLVATSARLPRVTTGPPACPDLFDTARRAVAPVAHSASRATPTTTIGVAHQGATARGRLR